MFVTDFDVFLMYGYDVWKIKVDTWYLILDTWYLHFLYVHKVNSNVRFKPGGPLKWQEGVSGSSMDTQKAP